MLASAGAHLVAALLLLLGGLLGLRADIDAVEPSTALDVEVVDIRAGVSARRDADRLRSDRPRALQDRSKPRAARRSATAARSAHARGHTIAPSTSGELPACSPLSMRGCRQPSREERDRRASFWGGRGGRRPRPPRVVSQAEANGVQLKRYADGGRLFTSTRGGQRRPDLGTVGLVDLARGRVGGRSGRSACNPYRVRLPGRRTLVLLVDTSASIDAAGHASRAVYCAAGAALAALQQGHEVELLNFSTGALHQPPTRDPTAIYSTLSTIQRRGTVLPPASKLVSSSGRPRDFVLVTDSAIGNLEWTLPAYRKAVRTHRGNRALLYLLGDGVVCPQCHYARNEICYVCSRSSRQTLVALEKAGFVAHFIERPSPVEELLARQMKRWMLP